MINHDESCWRRHTNCAIRKVKEMERRVEELERMVEISSDLRVEVIGDEVGLFSEVANIELYLDDAEVGFLLDRLHRALGELQLRAKQEVADA